MGLITKQDTQVLKGAAIAMVVVQHIGQIFHINAVNPLGPVGVFIFLFLSGFGLSCSYVAKGRTDYFKKKLFKIYFPYAIAMVLFLVWTVIIKSPVDFVTAIQYFVLLKLPQTSYWYMLLLFYWYIMFYFLTYIFDKDKALLTSLMVGTAAIILIKNFNRLYVWQFASFPLGIIAAKYSNQVRKIVKPLKSIRGGVFIISLVVAMVILKKMPFVEEHELGVMDTVLQIAITWCIGGWCLLFRRRIAGIRIMGTVLLKLGGISYEIYLAHVIGMDWLRETNPTERIGVYIAVTVITIIIIKLSEIVLLHIRCGEKR